MASSWSTYNCCWLILCHLLLQDGTIRIRKRWSIVSLIYCDIYFQHIFLQTIAVAENHLRNTNQLPTIKVDCSLKRNTSGMHCSPATIFIHNIQRKEHHTSPSNSLTRKQVSLNRWYEIVASAYKDALLSSTISTIIVFALFSPLHVRRTSKIALTISFKETIYII